MQLCLWQQKLGILKEQVTQRWESSQTHPRAEICEMFVNVGWIALKSHIRVPINRFHSPLTFSLVSSGKKEFKFV